MRTNIEGSSQFYAYTSSLLPKESYSMENPLDRCFVICNNENGWGLRENRGV